MDALIDGVVERCSRRTGGFIPHVEGRNTFISLANADPDLFTGWCWAVGAALLSDRIEAYLEERNEFCLHEVLQKHGITHPIN